MSQNNAIWRLVDKTASCWLWTGHLKESGYGQIPYAGKERRAHRYIYKLLRGEIPEGLVLDHLCGNPSCVNPNHLEPVTQKVNVIRGSGVCAVNSKKTHCIRGHLLMASNLYIYKSKQGPKRQCRICKQQQTKESKARRKL